MKHSMSSKYSGKEMEADLLGSGSPAAEYKGAYKNYREAVDEVIRNQPIYRDRAGEMRQWDPEDPPIHPTSFPSDLYTHVQDLLGDSIDQPTRLRMYNASGSTLDRLHGVDVLFVLEVGGRQAMVTLDITKNESKTVHKADVIALVPEGYVDSKDEDMRASLLNNWSEQIVEAFMDKLPAFRSRATKRAV